MNKGRELRPEERLITVSYATLYSEDGKGLMDRKDFIRKTLKDSLVGDQYISEEFISQHEDKYYLNFILTPNYITD